MLADFFLDLIFGIDRRLRERQIEIEQARQEQIRQARQHLIEELAAAEKAKQDAARR